MSGASPIDGSSSSSSFGPLIIARPIASICCSPPDRVPASWLLALLEHREQLEDALHHRLVAALALVGAHLEVLDHAHDREHPPALGHVADAERRRSRGPGRRRAACPSKRTPPDRRAQQPGDRAQRRGLAGAVRAEQRDDLALLHGEADALERLDRAVLDGDVVELEQAHAVSSGGRGRGRCPVWRRSAGARPLGGVGGGVAAAEVGLDDLRVALDLLRACRRR